MKRYLLIALLSIASINSFAQSGYMGKHVIIQLDASIKPYSFWLNYFDDHKMADAFINAPYFTLRPKIEYILWNRGTLAINYSYKSGGADFNTHKQPSITSSFNVNSIGIVYKQYYRKRAPMGGYVEFQYTNNIVTSEFKNVDPGLLDIYNYKETTTCYDAGLRIQFGYDYLFWKTMRVSWGISFGLDFLPVKYAISSDFPTEEEPNAWASIHVLRDTWFGINIGIGILAF